MNKYIIEKLKEGRANAKLKQSEVAEKIGIKGNTLSNYENGVSEPDIDTFCALCDIYNVDPSSILNEAYGLNVQGDEFKIKPSEIEHIKKYRALDPHGKSHVDSVLDWETTRVKSLQEKDNRIAELEASPAAIIEMPRHSFRSRHITEYFRDASAGSGIFILGNEVASKIAVSDSDWDDRVDFVIKVNGNSMEPDYMDGDNVMVSQHIEMKYGDVGIFVVNGSVYIKEYGKTELISHNPEFPNILVNEFDNIVCMGKVIGKLDGKYEIINE